MKYKIDVPRFGKFFTVPGKAEDYLKTADARYFKVLLCLLCSNSSVADLESVAESCGKEVTVAVAEDALIFWTTAEVISAEPLDGCEASKTKPAAVAASAEIKQPAAPPAPSNAARASVRYSNKEIAEKLRENDDLKTLFDEVQRIFGRTLNNTETVGFINIYEYYGYDVPSIVMIADFCRSIGKPKIAYIETVARDWFSRGICDFAQVESEIIKQTKQHDFNTAAARVLGIEGRLTKKQEEYFSQWKDWGFDEKTIDLAGERCRENKNKTDIRYVNGILSRWKREGLMTAEAVEEQERQFRENGGKRESSEESYDLNSWRSLADNFDPNALSFEEDDDI